LPNTKKLIPAVEEFVRQEMASFDGSHDFFHVDRVRRTGLQIAAEESVTCAFCVLVIELACLLHDVKDWKYTSGTQPPSWDSVRQRLVSLGCSASMAEHVVVVVENIGFKNDLKASSSSAAAAAPVVGDSKKAADDGSSTGASGKSQPPLLRLDDVRLETNIVSDADRLDAIGAVGIARCFTYGGSRHRPIHDPSIEPNVNMSKDEYMALQKLPAAKQPSVNHFYEKLLKLQDLMRTRSGKRRATQRHAYMESFLAQLLAECKGDK